MLRLRDRMLQKPEGKEFLTRDTSWALASDLWFNESTSSVHCMAKMT